MSSFAYYERIIRHGRAPDRSSKFIEGIRAVIRTFWKLKKEGKLPPLSIDDRDEALDRVMALLSPALQKYDPAHGVPVSAYISTVMRFAWLRCAHAVAEESERYHTGSLDPDSAADDVEDDSYDMPDDASEDDEDPRTSLIDSVVYASPPIGLGDPADEAALLQHIEAIAGLARDGSAANYRAAADVDERTAMTRAKRLLRAAEDA